MLKAIVQFSLANRLIVLIGAIAMCVYGVIAASKLPIDVLPDINKPTVSILTEAPGLAPEEVEAQVTLLIETAVNGAAGVERVRSTSGIGLSVVHVEFAWGTEIYLNRQVVQERLAGVQERLPTLGGERVTPHMGPISSIMGEVMLMGISSETLSLMDQRSTADWVLRPALLSVPGVAQVTVQGGEVRQFHVKADPDRLRANELTLEDLERAVSKANQNSGGGFLTSTSQELVVRNIGRVTSVEQLGDALVATRRAGDHSVVVRVRDVAKVVEGPTFNKRGEGSMMGKPAVILAIAKQPGADTRALTTLLDERLEQLRPGLPKGLTINTHLFRQGEFIQYAIDNVIHSLLEATVLVILVVGLFLLNLRALKTSVYATLITLTAIPISMLATFIVFKFWGQSVNTMTLGGIAVAVGELVDDAVVGVENSVRRLRENRALEKPRPALDVVFEATCEVRGPILIGTAIVLLVFLPLFFLPGLPGRLFTPLAQAYILSIFASMLVSLTLTPVLASYLLTRVGALKSEAEPERDGFVLRVCKAGAAWAYRVTMPRPWWVIGVCSVLVVIGGVFVSRVGTEFLPPFNEGTAVVSMNIAPGVSLEESDRMGRMAEQIILSVPEVKSVARRTGRAEQDEHALGVNSSEVEVDFWHEGEVAPKDAAPSGRTPPKLVRSRTEVFKDIREKLAAVPGALVSIGQPIGHRIDHLESGVQAQVVMKIFGPDFNQLSTLAEQVRSAASGIPGVADLQIEQQVLIPQLRVQVDPERAARYGFTVGELVDTLQTAIGGKVVSQILEGLRSYDLVVMLDDPWRVAPGGASTWEIASNLGDVRLVSPSGAIALVSDVATIGQHMSPNQVSRENAQRRIVVSHNVQGADLGSTVQAVQKSIAEHVTMPVGYTVQFEGQFQSQQRANRVIGWLGALSLLIMFALLWSHFSSGVMAVQVMLNIPFAFIGAVAALLITREPFSVASLIGFISLCGISARNGVLMVSHYIHVLTVERAPFNQETIVRASQERVAPVLMTALTTGLAMLPILISPEAPGKEVLYPVALVVFGGLVTSTLLDFFVTPTVFLRFCRPAAEKLIRRYTSENPTAEGPKKH